VTDFAYRLVVLTHGTHGPKDTLERALGSFFEHVTPAPAYTYLHQDGPSSPHYYAGFPTPIASSHDDPPLGFCGSTRKAWQEAAEGEQPYVFWLEHDFLLIRDVNLADLASLLDAHHWLAQMALMRTAVNEQEKAAGGLYESRRGEYEWHRSTPIRPVSEPMPIEQEWLSHRSYFTTNANLMRRQFMVENPWPADDLPECEGRFGIELVKRGYSFGVWGSGEPWTQHIGTRTGFGY
jgi:hypothetical protein